MKKLIPVLVVFFTICNSYAIIGQSFSGPVIRKVVIDPGHGGHDPGALSPDRKLREKDINLSVAKYLGQEINKKYPEIEVIYTRTKDVAVDLDRRGTLASEQHADLFISIHVNSARKSTSVPVGPETWVFGGDRSKRRDDSYDVVLKENEVIKFEDNYKAKYEGFDPDNPQSMIVFNFQKDAIMRQSRILGSCVQQSLRQGPLSGIEKDRGMKEGGFVVLAYCSMPAILVELGFINSSADRKILASDSGRKGIAMQLFLGFEKYMETYAPNNRQGENADQTPSRKHFRVQVLASATKLPSSDPVIASNPGIRYIICEDQVFKYKYTLGDFETRDQAQKYCNELRSGTFPDAFVIAVENDRLAPIN
ncbi:MAG: N-acetylmuramoyl-L-alanine amidase AmiC precursor [Bacteroidetes bacterium ADurb.Bin037]|nr:MAG: N-acetylmuramoyl-L-alanine amidase AmiC precursor [Bacteroidetes bacterium ADurb.Bin037]HPW77734.1 N-acetylmuramoyl-L-alanine amidase [Bacteroidales bacterium]HQB55459.1 N-acetylmuramoyl-L-alanine amidase [Bacteroidales bacterium]